MFKFPTVEIEEMIEVGADLWGVNVNLEKHKKNPVYFNGWI